MTARDGQLDGRTLAVGVLSVTATVLFVGFLLVVQRPAQAIGMLDRAGDYKMLTYRVQNSKELLVVVDAAAKKVLFYDFDIASKKLGVVNNIPLDQMPKPGTPEPAAPGQAQPGHRRRP
jgi:hypothetical protein